MKLINNWSKEKIDDFINREEIKLLIFDCDGTLMDTLRFHFRAWNDAYTKLGYPFITEEEFMLNYSGTSSNELIMQLNDKLDYSIDPEHISIIKDEIFVNHYLSEVKPIKKVLDLVTFYYQKIPITVASGGQRMAVKKMLKANKIEHLFVDVVTVEDVKNGKPHPDLFLKAAENQGVSNRNCIVFEDSEAGFIAASKAEMPCVNINLLIE